MPYSSTIVIYSSTAVVWFCLQSVCIHKALIEYSQVEWIRYRLTRMSTADSIQKVDSPTYRMATSNVNNIPLLVLPRLYSWPLMNSLVVQLVSFMLQNWFNGVKSWGFLDISVSDMWVKPHVICVLYTCFLFFLQNRLWSLRALKFYRKKHIFHEKSPPPLLSLSFFLLFHMQA